jgi:hypothetical protein
MPNLVTLPSQQFFKLHLHDLWKYQRRLRQYFVLALWALTMFCRRRQGTKASTTKVAGVLQSNLSLRSMQRQFANANAPLMYSSSQAAKEIEILSHFYTTKWKK